MACNGGITLSDHTGAGKDALQPSHLGCSQAVNGLHLLEQLLIGLLQAGLCQRGRCYDRGQNQGKEKSCHLLRSFRVR